MKYFPVPVPIEGIVTGSWTDAVLEKVGAKIKVNRKYYERIYGLGAYAENIRLFFITS